ncbi:MAG TPA: hypothetical protein EYQ81_01495, partial [Sneathiellales bacterium]|nr:hypothetical protein [Sneathiellales bacterium]
MSIADNKKVVLDAGAAITSGDMEAFYGALSDDVTWTFFGSHRYAGTFKGRKEIEEGIDWTDSNGVTYTWDYDVLYSDGHRAYADIIELFPAEDAERHILFQKEKSRNE